MTQATDSGLRPRRRYTMGNALEDWLGHGVDGLSARTVSLYRSTIVKALNEEPGAVRLTELTASDVQRALAAQAGSRWLGAGPLDEVDGHLLDAKPIALGCRGQQPEGLPGGAGALSDDDSRWPSGVSGEEAMQLTAAQTSLEPHPHRVSRTGRRPFVSQNTRRRRQPTRERARPAQRPRITDPRAPGDDLNKLPTRRG